MTKSNPRAVCGKGLRAACILLGILIAPLGSLDARDAAAARRTVEIIDGYAFGRGPGDVFRLPARDNQNLTVIEDTLGTSADNVLEISGLDPAKPRVSVEFGGELNLYWYKERSGVIVQNEFLKLPGHHLGVDRIHFNSGVTWTRADLEKRLGTAKLKLALTPAESARPFTDIPAQRFVLGSGGNDRITMLAGETGLTVLEVASTAASNSEILIPKSFPAARAEVFDDHGDAVISWYGNGSGRLTVAKAFLSRPGAHYGVARLRFGDGKVWTLKDLVARSGGAGAAESGGHVAGSTAGERLDTGGKTRFLEGRGGGDTIVYQRGYGDLDIDEADESAHPANRLVLGTGITPAMITVTRSNDDLVLTVETNPNRAGDAITLQGAYRRSPGVTRGVQTVIFADGTRWTYAVMARLAATGSEDNRNPEGDESPNIFHVGENTNSVTGHGGGDSFFVEAGIYGVVIKEADRGAHQPNRLFMPEGVRQADVVPLRDGADLFLEFRETGPVSGNGSTRGITLSGQNQPDAGVDAGVQEVVFADGSRWSGGNLLRLARAQPLDRAAYDAHEAAQRDADTKARFARANDPERFARFIADLHAGLDRIGINRPFRDALIAGTALAQSDGEIGPPQPARWYDLATLGRWKAGIAALTTALRARYVIADASQPSLCDLGPCPPPTRAEITAETLDALAAAILPNLQLDGTSSGAVPAGPQAQLIRTDPLRIASSGDAKTDAAIGAVLKRRVGIPEPLLDDKSFPVTRAGANVLLYSLGTWEAFPTGPDQEDEHVRQIWRSHRAWLVGPVLPAANPLFTFVSGKVGGDLSRIKALLVRGKIESDLLIAVDGKGAVIAGACHTSPYEDEVTQCLQRVALALPPLNRGRQEVRPVAARVLTSVTEPTVSWLQRAGAAISNAFQWLLSALRHLLGG
jgi:hypothetical protein